MGQFRSECLRETGTTDEQIEQFNSPQSVQASHELQCYMYCMFRLHNVTRPNGELDLIDVYHAIPKQFNSIALKVLAKCNKSTGPIADACERAYSHHRCWKETEPEVSDRNYYKGKGQLRLPVAVCLMF